MVDILRSPSMLISWQVAQVGNNVTYTLFLLRSADTSIGAKHTFLRSNQHVAVRLSRFLDFNFLPRNLCLFLPRMTSSDGGRKELRLRISMDRISDSDSEDAGSIPAGATKAV